MTQLTWPHLLSVALRIDVSQALLSSDRGLENFIEDAPARAVLDEFQLAAAAQLAACGREYRNVREARKEGPAVDAYYRRVGEALRSQASPASNRSPLARELFAAIQGVCSRSMCIQCDSKPCRWMRTSAGEDESRVAKSGLCLRRITDLFQWTSEVTASAYASACQGCTTSPPILTTGHGERNGELELAITGVTYQRTIPPAKDRRRLHLNIDPGTVWIPDHLSLPYVFMHECVAHAWCGVDVEDEAAARSKPFHEGWMDSIASLLLEKSLFSVSGGSRNFASEMWTQARLIRGLRFNSSRASQSPDVWDWIRGAKALEALWWLFCQAQSERSPETDWDRASLDAREALLTLSLRINASRMPHALRARLVLALAKNYARCGAAARAKALSNSPQVIDFIQEYDQSGDAERFVRKVVEI